MVSRIFLRERGVMAERGIVDEQIEPAGQGFDPPPEALSERRIRQVAGHDKNPPRRQLGGQRLQAVQSPGGRQDRQTPIADQLPDEFAADAGRGASDEGVWGFQVAISRPSVQWTDRYRSPRCHRQQIQK